MAYDGAGVFSVLYNWATEAASPPIAISKLDAEFAGIATGLSTCMLRTGGTFTNDVTLSKAGTISLTLSGTMSRVVWTETDAATDEKTWEWRASGGDFFLYTNNDGGSAVGIPVAITRTGTTVDAITFNGTQINLTCTAAAVNGDLAVDGAITCTDAGSFTVEWATATSGGATLESGTAYWKKVGGVVTMRLPALIGTTTAYDLYLRGIPAACQPALTGSYTQLITVQGSVNGSYGPVTIMVAEGVAYWKVEGAYIAFSSASGAKGVGLAAMGGGPTITYQVTD